MSRRRLSRKKEEEEPEKIQAWTRFKPMTSVILVRANFLFTPTSRWRTLAFFAILNKLLCFQVHIKIKIKSI